MALPAERWERKGSRSNACLGDGAAESRKLRGKWVKEGKYSRSEVAGLLDMSHLLCIRSFIENQPHSYNFFFISFFPSLCLFPLSNPPVFFFSFLPFLLSSLHFLFILFTLFHFIYLF